MSETITLPIVIPLAALIPGLLLAFSYGRLAQRVEELARGLARVETALGTSPIRIGAEERRYKDRRGE
jgi:hypothetical protein